MLRRSKNILQIYEETKQYDLVITNDAPLATGLNKLIDAPRLDYFAMTPKQLAAKYAGTVFDKIYPKSEIILEIVKKTGKPLPMVHQSIEKIFEIWNHTGLLDSCEMFLNSEKEFLPLLRDLPTVELAMEMFSEDYLGEKKIAVAGYELFTELDKQVLPKRNLFINKISLFTGEANEIEKTYVFNSANDMINKAVGIINKSNADETAVILNTESDYLEIIKSRLMEKGIKCEIKNKISQDTDTRDFISFIDVSFNSSELKVKEIIFLESLTGEKINRYYSNYYLSGYLEKLSPSKTLMDMCKVISSVEKFTYARLLDKIESAVNRELTPELRGLLELLELSDKKINTENFNMLSYFIKNIDAEISSGKEGVLFVNSKNSAFVDRPVTIFIGLDESWTKTFSDKDYIIKKEEEEKNLDKFQILLSQGDEKLIFAVRVRDNVPVIPCYYFNILCSKDIRNFDNKFFNPVYISSESKVNIFNPVKVKFKKTESNPLDSISPTSLNSFITCPKKYSYSRMIPPENQTYLLKGNLLHNFAELYFNHPEYVKENFEKILQQIMEEYKLFLKDMNTSVEKTVFRIGMNAIMRFLDEKNFTKHKLKIPESNESNILFKLSGKKKIYSNTEKRIWNIKSGMNGKIDLSSGNVIVDYKSGKNTKSNATLLKEFRIGKMSEERNPEINFQTVSYLAGTRDLFPGDEINFTYLFFLSNIADVIAGNDETSNSAADIKYIPLTFKDYLLSRQCFDKLNNDLTVLKENDILQKTGYEEYRRIIEEKFDDEIFFNKDSVINIYQEAFYNHLLCKLGFTLKDFNKRKPETFIKDIILPLLQKLYYIRTGEKGEAYIFKDDADEFIGLAKKAIDEINVFQKSVFPNKPFMDIRDVCIKCEFLNLCTGNKLWSGNE